MLYLIGSQAIALQIPDWLEGRATKDWDFIGSSDDFRSLVQRLTDNNRIQGIGYVKGPTGRNIKGCARFLDKQGKFFAVEVDFDDVPDQMSINNANLVYFDTQRLHQVQIADVKVWCIAQDLDTNLLLKLSHRYKKNSQHFHKTMQDIQLLRLYGAKVKEIDEGLLKQREALTLAYKHPSLQQGKRTFFTDNVPYKYDHDSIHRAVAIAGAPAYLSYMQDGAEVQCDKEKFFDLPYSHRLYGVVEECFVLALERAIIPHGTEANKAFEMALEKVCTSITSGWFREFAWENYDAVMGTHAVLQLQCFDFVQKFNDALDAGLILPYDAGNKY
jgi:hypothetical protein